jgi:hypothetical protein
MMTAVHTGRMRMSKRSHLAATLLLLACGGLSGCATSVKYASKYDRSADFSRYSSYAMNAGRKIDDPDLQRLAENIINEELARKGFHLTATAPDLMIGLAPFAVDGGGGMLAAGTITWSYQGPYDGLAISAGGNGYKDGELNVSFTDTRTGALVWSGIMHGKLSYDDREGNYRRVTDTLRALIRSFPPPKS